MHRLALALGRTVEELLAGLSARSLRRWKVYARLEPFGAHRDNVYAAMGCALLFNGFRGPKTKPAEWTDFMLRDPERARHEAQAKMIAALRAIATPGPVPKRKRPKP